MSSDGEPKSWDKLQMEAKERAKHRKKKEKQKEKRVTRPLPKPEGAITCCYNVKVPKALEPPFIQAEKLVRDYFSQCYRVCLPFHFLFLNS